MSIAFWIVGGLTALMSIAAGSTKVTQSLEKLVKLGMNWTKDYSVLQVRGIGSLEIIAGLGIVLPILTGIAPILSPLAAVGLVIVMIGAVLVHKRLKESATPAIALGVLAAITAVLGFFVVLG